MRRRLTSDAVQSPEERADEREARERDADCREVVHVPDGTTAFLTGG
jgi:hypothetical protein